VIIVAVAETNADYSAEGMGAVSRYLLRNEGPAETEIIETRGVTAGLLASAAQRHRAGLVALGAYGHSQMRERLFGGCKHGAACADDALGAQRVVASHSLHPLVGGACRRDRGFHGRETRINSGFVYTPA
jgi:hypothetical protein